MRGTGNLPSYKFMKFPEGDAGISLSLYVRVGRMTFFFATFLFDEFICLNIIFIRFLRKNLMTRVYQELSKLSAL